MLKNKSVTFFLLTLLSSMTNNALAKDDLAATVFKTYCWGCHHQTAQAFGPSFKAIAAHRNKAQITAQIIAPQNNYKLLGYKRSSMPAFNDLNSDQLNSIVNYILSFKKLK